jgi:hypothetical protein
VGGRKAWAGGRGGRRPLGAAAHLPLSAFVCGPHRLAGEGAVEQALGGMTLTLTLTKRRHGGASYWRHDPNPNPNQAAAWWSKPWAA